ncbi:MAG TPA: hypothetical protein DCL17_04670, partial [Dehalococcoidia bacterium]|nr:hypothetical protein [Dehalococcoidia bacterium]
MDGGDGWRSLRRTLGKWNTRDLCSSIAYSGWEGLWGPPYLPVFARRWFAETTAKYKHDAWDAVLAQHGTEDIELRDSIIERHRTERISRLRPYLGVEELLMQVSAKYPLGLVTNGSPAVQRFKLERAGLSGFFSA